ncbi:MAG: acyl carrier protein [Pirellulales bacterium]|nr:acyl carrier protein [Pirellulales bacterium]
MARLGILLIASVIAGCGPSRAPETIAPHSSMLANVQSIIAKQLGLKDADVIPEMTFGGVGADDLDLVEITMEVEDRFGITISEDALVSAAGIRDTDSLCDHLTIRKFATVAEAAPKQPQERPSPVTDDGTLRESQVGAFGDLSKLPNPNGLMLVFVPSFEELTQIQAQRLGRELDDTEIEALRQKAAVIALPQEMAEKLKQQKSERDANKRE